MKKYISALAVAVMLAVPFAGVAVQAQEAGALCSYCWEKGEFTTANPEASRVLLLPVRAVTAVVGAPVGAINGMGEAIPPAVAAVSDKTFKRMPTEDYGDGATNFVANMFKWPALLTGGIVGTAVAVPVAGTYGFVKGAGEGLAKGFMYPDQF